MDDITSYQVWFVYRDEEKDEDDRKAVAQARPEVAPWAKKIASEAEFLGLPSMRRQALRIAQSRINGPVKRFMKQYESFVLDSMKKQKY